MTTVTLLTHDATLDDLSVSDYRDMFDELRPIDPKTNKRLSLDKFIAAIGSEFSKALWGRYDNGEVGLNRAQRSELRVACDWPPLPMTVADATAQASPDAAVWSIGNGPADHVIMVTTVTPLTLHVNGAVTVLPDAQTSHVTGVTDRQVERSRVRRTFYRPCATETQEGRRSAIGASWRDVIEAGLKALEGWTI